MRNFDYTKLAQKTWDMEIISYLTRIYEYKGKQRSFLEQKPAELKRLTDEARIQSTEASNRIEGIVTTSARMKQLFAEKTSPRNRDEEEIMGYRDVLNTIHENYEYIPLRSSYILQLHRDMLKATGLAYAGHYKNVQNYINETRADGTVRTRFIPLAPYETEGAIEAVCDSYARTIALDKVDPLILIPSFICDFLCIHPFNDGNGRMSRLLTLLLLYQNGYEVGKYVSIEDQIEKTKDSYYEALEESGRGWHEEQNDTTPFIRYMLKVILACYVEFEERLGISFGKGNTAHTAYDIVCRYISEKIGKFTSAEVMEACPEVGRSSVLNTLKELTEQGQITKMGNGRNTCYIRNDAIKKPR